MEQISLDVEVRQVVGSQQIKKIRNENCVPAIVYGEAKTPTPIQVKKSEYEKIMRAHHGQSVIFHLNVLENGKKLRDYAAIVKQEQLHPVDDHLLHLDFQRISLDKEIQVPVAIDVKGIPMGVKQQGGSLEHMMWELQVICLPTKIPAKIEIDVTHLEIGKGIHIKDIKLPDGVRTNVDPDAMVVSVVASMKEEVAAPVVEEVEAAAEPAAKGKEEKTAEAPEAKKAEK